MKTGATRAPDDFFNYWGQNKAEITSYHLEQARYGQAHSGHAVLIFVTEPFWVARQVKDEYPEAKTKETTTVLKLNLVKKFNTGIYPYSVMTSVFTPVDEAAHGHTLKVTTSSQEWCGHTFTQLNLHGEAYRARLHSYFENEGDQEFDLPLTWLEDELWNRIRINPDRLPQGEFTIIPGTMYQRFSHSELKPERAVARLQEAKGQMNYSIEFRESKRSLSITFNKDFPHEITAWEEHFFEGMEKGLMTRAKRNKTMMTDYWQHNKLQDQHLRQKLGLK